MASTGLANPLETPTLLSSTVHRIADHRMPRRQPTILDDTLASIHPIRTDPLQSTSKGSQTLCCRQRPTVWEMPFLLVANNLPFRVHYPFHVRHWVIVHCHHRVHHHGIVDCLMSKICSPAHCLGQVLHWGMDLGRHHDRIIHCGIFLDISNKPFYSPVHCPSQILHGRMDLL